MDNVGNTNVQARYQTGFGLRPPFPIPPVASNGVAAEEKKTQEADNRHKQEKQVRHGYTRILELPLTRTVTAV